MYLYIARMALTYVDVGTWRGGTEPIRPTDCTRVFCTLSPLYLYATEMLTFIHAAEYSDPVFLLNAGSWVNTRRRCVCMEIELRTGAVCVWCAVTRALSKNRIMKFNNSVHYWLLLLISFSQSLPPSFPFTSLLPVTHPLLPSPSLPPVTIYIVKNGHHIFSPENTFRGGLSQRYPHKWGFKKPSKIPPSDQQGGDEPEFVGPWEFCQEAVEGSCDENSSLTRPLGWVGLGGVWSVQRGCGKPSHSPSLPSSSPSYRLEFIPEEEVTRYMYNPRSGKWKTDQVVVKMNSEVTREREGEEGR